MRFLTIALSALAIAVAGCGGGSSESSYREDFQPVNRSLVRLGQSVGQALRAARGKSDAQIGREFGGYADRLGKIQKDLDDLNPPDKLAREQDGLVRAVGRARRALRGIANAARHKDFNAARQATIRLVISSVGLKKARERLTRDVSKGG
jgi:hypothetical protein